MVNQPVSNENDFKVVEFVNSTDFDFTPEMGAMYDGRPIFGISGAPCIKSGERLSLPYHIGNQLALNLAKQSLIRNAPGHDPVKDTQTSPRPLWDDSTLQSVKNSFITELYLGEKPVAMSETDKLMAQVAELNKIVRENFPQSGAPVEDGQAYKDKSEVIAELTKRGITFNARDSKAKLEQLLA